MHLVGKGYVDLTRLSQGFPAQKEVQSSFLVKLPSPHLVGGEGAPVGSFVKAIPLKEA